MFENKSLTTYRAVTSTPRLHVLWSVGVGMVCVWMSLGCIVLESGGRELEEDESTSRREGRSPDEFENFEELDPESMPPDEVPIPSDDPVDDPVPRSPEDFVLMGDVQGGPEQGGELVVLWYVNTGETPYFYKYGEGSLSPDGEWGVSVPGGVFPREALNVDGVGMAFVMGLEPWTERFEDGRLDREAFRVMEQAAFGVSRGHALIHVAVDGQPLRSRTWAAEFEPGGVACAKPLTGEARGVEPVACDAFELVVTREFSWLMF